MPQESLAIRALRSMYSPSEWDNPEVPPPLGQPITTGLGPPVDRATTVLNQGDRVRLMNSIQAGKLRFTSPDSDYQGAYEPLTNTTFINPSYLGVGNSALAGILAHEIQHQRQASFPPEPRFPFAQRPYPSMEDAMKDPHTMRQFYWRSPDEEDARLHATYTKQRPVQGPTLELMLLGQR